MRERAGKKRGRDRKERKRGREREPVSKIMREKEREMGGTE